MSDLIDVTSLIASRDLRPFVSIRWGQMACQLTPEEARQHAYGILEAAEAAESDSIMIRFLQEKVGLEKADLSQILQEFRIFRGQKFTVKEGMSRTSLQPE